MEAEDHRLFEAAWEVTRAYHGYGFTFFLPGMVRYGRDRGRYPAVSITGTSCRLMCEHCRGRLLQPMIHVSDPEEMLQKGRRLGSAGSLGLLLSGGSDSEGRLPWERYQPAIARLRKETSLHLSAHVGFPSRDTCLHLREAGIAQALIDVMGDEETASRIYHLPGLRTVLDSLEAISESGLQLVPHIVAGLYYGKIRSEQRAIEILKPYRPAALVIVVLTPLKMTPMEDVSPPSPLEVARLIARARLAMPDVPIALGCERPRNREGLILETLAIRAGANRMAVWSEEAIEEAYRLGLTPRFQPTCCSLEYDAAYSLTPSEDRRA